MGQSKVAIEIYHYKNRCDIETYKWDEEKNKKTNTIIEWNSQRVTEKEKLKKEVENIKKNYKVMELKEYHYNEEEFKELKCSSYEVYTVYPAQLERTFIRLLDELYDYRPILKVEYDNYSAQPVKVFFKKEKTEEFQEFWEKFLEDYEIDEEWDEDELGEIFADILLKKSFKGKIKEFITARRDEEIIKRYESYIKIFVEPYQ